MTNKKEKSETSLPQRFNAAFVIGVTGNMDPVSYGDFAEPPKHPAPEVQAITDKVYAILDWLRGVEAETHGCLDPDTGVFSTHAVVHSSRSRYADCWKPLELGDLPIIVLSSLAPGVDTLVAEAALKYAEERKAPVSVRAPLPFPVGIYEHASTFPTPNKKARFRHVVTAIRSQLGFCEARDLFSIGLHPSRDGDPEADLNATDPGGGKRRRLRYRAAGEFVAAYCDLLLAVYDKEFDDQNAGGRAARFDIYDSGTVAIVQAKREGLTHDLLPVQNVFDWSDNGPVLHIPICRQKRPSISAGPRNLGSLAFFHPFDCRPAECDANCPLDDPRWQSAGDAILRSVAADLVQLHTEPVRSTAKGEARALFSMLGESEAAVDVVRTTGGLFDFDSLARSRRNVADINGHYDTEVRGRTGAFFLLGIIAIVGLQVFENFDFGANPAPHLPPTGRVWWNLAFLALAIAAVTCAMVLFRRFQRDRDEDRQLDSRCVADGLKVQFYWAAAGTGESVATRYLQRQRSELSWIRSAISSITFPHRRTVDWFRALPAEEKASLLGGIQKGWLEDQRRYFSMKTAAFVARKHSLHAFGSALLLAGFLLIVANVFVHTLHVTRPFLIFRWWLLGSGLAVLAALAYQWVNERNAHEGKPSKHPDASHFWRYFFPRSPCLCRCDSERWPRVNLAFVGTALAATGLGLAFGPLEQLNHLLGTRNDPANWLNIGKNFALVGGGLVHLWTARRFLSENIRRYRSMLALFAGACESMDAHLQTLAAEGDSSAGDAAVKAIQDLLVTVGCESLAENAEWLLMHRDRRVEPVIPGA